MRRNGKRNVKINTKNKFRERKDNSEGTCEYNGEKISEENTQRDKS